MNKQKEKIKEYIESPKKQQQLYKRTLTVVILAQIFGGAGLAVGVTVGALLAQDLLGADSVTGVPSMLFTLGAAGAALFVGRVSQRYGRRFGLTAGFLGGALGAVGVIIAAVSENIILLFLALLIYGAGSATNLQARYAGTDLANSDQRAKAVSMAMVSSTLGAVAGPNLVSIMGNMATSIGIPALAGPFLLAAASYFLAGLIFFLLLRPDPFLVAKEIRLAKELSHTHSSGTEGEHLEIDKRGIFAGAFVMIISQFTMVAIMTMTPIHMGHYGHGLNDVGFVIGLHVGAMYLPSLITGYLVDKIGRVNMAFISSITLLLAGVTAAFGPPESIVAHVAALILLGLGWNFGLISGTAMLVDATSAITRAKTQGSVDVLISLAGAIGGGLSGVIVAHAGYMTLTLSGVVLAISIIPVVILAIGYLKEWRLNH
ncbi:MFS transporter [Oceanobacillus sp. J11TS1]|uniref:MFS transporter n=1 Tax=Oceanobacillus sp. J11TS1 TaxID=2807191 RepID=UPI001B033B09|nr:MFS transporter [Oceanobacillus sp. J11TS1]GIO22895.1 putative MFS-type transporter YdeG [Oceanobacillus sp. J11TS1]